MFSEGTSMKRFTIEEFATLMGTVPHVIRTLVWEGKCPVVWKGDWENEDWDYFIPDMLTDVAEQVQRNIEQERRSRARRVRT